MTGISNPHDRFFKETFSRVEVAKDFVAHYLPPEMADLLVLDSLEVVKDTFVDGELSEYYSDLLYKIDSKRGESAYVYVLFDHKSYYDPLVGFQLLRYMVRIWERSLRKRETRGLPVIIPVVIYHGRGRWKARSRFEELFEAGDEFRDVVPSFRYLLCDLRRYSDDDIKGVVLSKVAILALKHIFSDDLSERLPGILSLLRELSGKRSGMEYLETVLRYVASGSDRVSQEDLVESVREAFDQEGGEIMPTLAEKWIEEGMEKGLRQGMQQGMLQEAREMVLEAISSRFGMVPEDIVRDINGIEQREQLKALLRQAVLCEDLDSFREVLRKR